MSSLFYMDYQHILYSGKPIFIGQSQLKQMMGYSLPYEKYDVMSLLNIQEHVAICYSIFRDYFFWYFPKWEFTTVLNLQHNHVYPVTLFIGYFPPPKNSKLYKSILHVSIFFGSSVYLRNSNCLMQCKQARRVGGNSTKCKYAHMSFAQPGICLYIYIN